MERSIEKNISPGSFVKAGQLIGKSGNTGTKESTLGTKKESHLHWEMILQKNDKEIYEVVDRVIDMAPLVPERHTQ